MIVTLAAAAVLSVAGEVQFWQRHCDAAGVCGLPTAVSHRLTIDGDVTAPAGPGQLGTYKTEMAAGEAGLTMTLEVFWKGEDQQGEPYVAAQVYVRQSQANGRVIPLSQCNGFHDVPADGIFFPVGVCGGFLPNADDTVEEYGVTFYRAPR